MPKSAAATVDELIAALPPDRREAISAVRKVILDNLPPGYTESIQYGMIGYGIPLSRYPDTYNGQPLGIAALASQKGYMSVYLMGIYGSPELREWFERAYRASGKRLDMGKACVRFKSLADLPLDVVGQAIARLPVGDYIALHEKSRAATSRPAAKAKARPAAKAGSAAKPAAKSKATPTTKTRTTPAAKARATPARASATQPR